MATASSLSRAEAFDSQDLQITNRQRRNEHHDEQTALNNEHEEILKYGLYIVFIRIKQNNEGLYSFIC